MSALVVLAVLLTGCGSGGHSGSAKPSTVAIAEKNTPSASPSSSVTPLTVANVYARVRQAESTYPALHGTITVSETTPTQRFQLRGSFATDLQDFGGAANSMSLQTSNPVGTLELRTIGNTIYDRSSGRPAWEKSADPYPTDNRLHGLRNLVGQLMGPLDPQFYEGMLSTAPDLKQLPAKPGQTTFTGTFPLASFSDPAYRFAPLLIVYYSGQKVNYMTVTVGLDAQARPISLHEKLHSATLNLDYQITITGYRPTKIVAPI